MMLELAWVGTSESREKINYEDNNNKNSNQWADWVSDEEFEGVDAIASTNHVVGVRERTTRYQSLHTPTIVVTDRPGSSATSCSCWRTVARSAVYRVGPLFTCAVQRVDRGGSQI